MCQWPGRPHTIEDERITGLIRKTLKTQPKDGSTQSSYRTMTANSQLSKSTVQSVWSAFGLQPQRQKHFKLSCQSRPFGLWRKAMSRIVDAVKSILPRPLRAALSRALYPYRHGRRFFTPYVIKKEMEGATFDFLIGDRTGRNWYDRACINNPIWLEMRFIRDHVAQKGDVVLECGSHHGCSTILLSSWVGASGKVVAFEPFPANFEILEKNVRLNNLRNVLPRMEALGAASGTITFDEASSAVTSSGNGVHVKVSRLDEYEHLNPTFLKIDVEGFEMQVLRGAKNILWKRPKLAIELHTELLPQFGASVEDIFGLIGVENYRVWIQRRDDQQPEEFDMRTPIESRVHLFFIPIAS